MRHIDNGGVRTNEGTLYNATAIYFCNLGYYMSTPNPPRLCGEGVWSEIEPVCKVYGVYSEPCHSFVYLYPFCI